MTGFFEVALGLLVEGILQGDIGRQADNEAGYAERHHQDGNEARAQVRHIPHFLGGSLGVFHATPSRTKANVEMLHGGDAPYTGAFSASIAGAEATGGLRIRGAGVTGRVGAHKHLSFYILNTEYN